MTPTLIAIGVYMLLELLFLKHNRKLKRELDAQIKELEDRTATLDAARERLDALHNEVKATLDLTQWEEEMGT